MTTKDYEALLESLHRAQADAEAIATELRSCLSDGSVLACAVMPLLKQAVDLEDGIKLLRDAVKFDNERQTKHGEDEGKDK